MSQIIERQLAVTSALEIEGSGSEIGCTERTTITAVANLVQHLLAQSVDARAQPGQTAELDIRVTADGQRVQVSGRVVVRWIVSARRRALGAVDKPLKSNG